MSAFQGFLEGPVSEAIGWGLLHSLWQGAIIALLLFVLLKQLAGQSANLRYVVCSCALALLVILPVLTVYESFDDTRALDHPVSARSIAAPDDAESVSAFLASVKPAAGSIERARSFAASNLQVIVGIWFLGVAFLSGRLFAGWLRLRRLAGEDRRAPDHLVRTLNSLADRLEIWRPIRLVQSRLVEVPILIGWLEPVILLPITALTGLTPQQLETILAHELAHVRRHDFLFNLAQTMIETLLFYHPATWWISRQVRLERENCCDDLAVEVCGNPLVYARALASLEESRSSSVLGLAVSGGSLLSRIRRVVSAPESKCASGWVARLSAVMMAGALLIGMPLTILALTDQAAEPGPGITMTVTAPAIPAEPLEAAEPDVVIADKAPMENVVAQADVVIPQLDEIDWIAIPTEEPPTVFVELDHLGELFHLEELANGSLKIALFEIVQEEVAERQRDSGPPRGERHRKLTVDELIALKRYGVTPAYIESMQRTGMGELSMKELRSMALHGVTAEYVLAMERAGFGELDHEELIALRIHGVNPEMVAALREAASSELDADEVTSAAIHGVTPAWIAEMKAAGLGQLDIDELVSLRIHGVSPAWIAKMKAAGLGQLDIDELVSFRIHGVSPTLIDDIRALGLADFSFDTVKRMSIHGVDADYVRQIRSAGYGDLEGEDLIRFRIHGVDPSFIAGMGRLGYSNISPRDLIRLKIHGVTEAWVEGLQQSGHARLSVDDLVRLRIRGTEELSRSRSRNR